ncbi:MAG: DUF1738 domain-containing protein [Armatimonadetes bacterium]|nr:DUF1738 domain-containing protein [Armatimonadota bacterium]
MDDKVQRLAKSALQRLTTDLAGGQSQALSDYLKTMSRFHKYSWFNCLLIWGAKPEAKFIAGYRKWEEFGRHVRRGEKGICIVAPIARKGAKADSHAEDGSILQTKGFIGVHVWDISQTDGQDLPTIGKRTGNPGIYLERLKQFAADSGIKLEYLPSLGGPEGKSSGGRIQIKQGMSAPDELGVLAHELAHELIHQHGKRGDKTKKVLELEAEAVAYAICEGVGISSGTASADYIQLYRGDAALLMESLATIQRAAASILKAVLD